MGQQVDAKKRHSGLGENPLSGPFGFRFPMNRMHRVWFPRIRPTFQVPTRPTAAEGVAGIAMGHRQHRMQLRKAGHELIGDGQRHSHCRSIRAACRANPPLIMKSGRSKSMANKSGRNAAGILLDSSGFQTRLPLFRRRRDAGTAWKGGNSKASLAHAGIATHTQNAQSH